MQTMRLDRSPLVTIRERRANVPSWLLFYQMLLRSGSLMAVLIAVLLTTAYAFQRLQIFSMVLKHHETVPKTVEIEVQSAPGEGSAFRFTLPLAAPNEALAIRSGS